MEVIKLKEKSIEFYGHLYKGNTNKLFVFLPGFMEPKAGLFYIWHQIAQKLYERGSSCLLFDLAGQGDSLLEMSIENWKIQYRLIVNKFSDYEIYFISRGISVILLDDKHKNIAILPSLNKNLSNLLNSIRWKVCKDDHNFLSVKYPLNLNEEEIKAFHFLGAEAACIGGGEINKEFINSLSSILPKDVPQNTLCINPEKEHPLFDKFVEREKLIKDIEAYYFF
jgi:hypothetical protein